MLTPRQEEILVRVVEEYVATGAPVGSKTLVQRAAMDVSSSTVRYELAMLEEQGLLSHPHTSAGRVPTDLGYRFFVDRVIEKLEPRPSELALDLDFSELRSEVETALQTTTDALAEVTHLLALVSAPPLEATTVRRVEVLLLQPELVMVVVITATGGVTKRLFTFARAVDPGLAEWAGEYLNESFGGRQLGGRMLRARLEDPQLGAREREFLAELRPAFAAVLETPEQAFYVGRDRRRARGVSPRRACRVPAAPRGARAACGRPRAHAGEPRLQAALRASGLGVRGPPARDGLAGWRAVRAAAPESRDSQPRRADADGLRQGDRCRPHRREGALPLRRGLRDWRLYED